MHKKKGISPLIGTVLLIGFTIGLAILIFSWGTKFTTNLTEKTGEKAEKEIAFGADVGVKIKSAEAAGNTINLLVENTGKTDIEKFKIRVLGNEGADVINTYDGLEKYGIKNFNVSFNSAKTGNITEVEAFPIIISEGEEAISKDVYDKIKISYAIEEKITPPEEDTTPPGAITNLVTTEIGTNNIRWQWANPSDADFSKAVLYLNGNNIANTSDNYYNAAGLTDDTNYTIVVHTADESGNVNNSDIYLKAKTLYKVDLTMGLVGYWTFNGNANDISGNNNNGAVNGAVYQAGVGYGGSGAYSYDGANDFILIPQSSSLKMSNYLAISLWIKDEESSGSSGMILQQRYGGSQGSYSVYRSTGNTFSCNVNNAALSLNVGALSAGLHHLLCVFNLEKSYSVAYVDGVKKVENKIYNSQISGDGAVYIGGVSVGSSSWWFKGKIDEMRVYNREFRQEDITALLSLYGFSQA